MSHTPDNTDTNPLIQAMPQLQRDEKLEALKAAGAGASRTEKKKKTNQDKTPAHRDPSIPVLGL